MSGAPGRRKRSTSVLLRTGYFPMLPAWLVPGPTLPWLDGLRLSLFLLSRRFIPVVVPGFILPMVSLVAPGPTLPWLDSPGAGWLFWADATALAPNSEATTSAETANLDRMGRNSFSEMMRKQNGEQAISFRLTQPKPGARSALRCAARPGRVHRWRRSRGCCGRWPIWHRRCALLLEAARARP